MKYGIFVLLDEPSANIKATQILMDEAQSRGWHECQTPGEVEKLVRDMVKKGFRFVGKRDITSGPSAEGTQNGRWGYGLYFWKE